MKKQIKFPLIMKDGATVRDLEELWEHFDLETIFKYFRDGRLLIWLENRRYETERKAVEALQPEDERVLEYRGVQVTLRRLIWDV